MDELDELNDYLRERDVECRIRARASIARAKAHRHAGRRRRARVWLRSARRWHAISVLIGDTIGGRGLWLG